MQDILRTISDEFNDNVSELISISSRRTLKSGAKKNDNQSEYVIDAAAFEHVFYRVLNIVACLYAVQRTIYK